jgi:hypothetical protein
MSTEPKDVAAWLDLGAGITTVADNGASLPQQKKLNLVGFTVVDDPSNQQTTVTSAAGGSNATSIQGKTVDATAPTLSGSGLYYDPTSGKYLPRRGTLDDLDPAFTPTLSFASGGAAVEVAQPGITPTLQSSPAPNSGGGLTVATISDSLGGGPTSRITSGNPFQGPATTYTAPSAPGSLTFTLAMTKNGVPKTATASIPIDYRFCAGLETQSGATSATASGGSATLSGGGASATLAGSLAANMIGTTFAYGTPSGAGQWVYALYPHTASPGTFVDAATNFGFSMSVVATFNFTTQYGVVVSYDLYRSDFIQTVARTVKRTA